MTRNLDRLADPLPVGTRLLHIGPQKTGTTTLQGAFHARRKLLAGLGVHYAGPRRQARIEAAAVVTKEVMPGYPADSLDYWPRLVEEVSSSRADRVVISAEMFANAGDDTIVEVIDAFGPQTHVVLTLRPLVKILPSQWQQFVQSGLTLSYSAWLTALFAEEANDPYAKAFWHRHDHAALASRWAEVVGADRVTVVALDEQDRGMNLRAFEDLLDLPGGTLVPTSATNRSLTLAEVEFIRHVNLLFNELGWPKDSYNRGIRFGMDYFLREWSPSADDEPIRTPQWALDAATERARLCVEHLGASTMNIVGDLSKLDIPASGPDDVPKVDSVDVTLAARAALGVLRGTEIKPPRMGREKPASTTQSRRRTAEEMSTREIVETLARRGRQRLRKAISRSQRSSTDAEHRGRSV